MTAPSTLAVWSTRPWSSGPPGWSLRILQMSDAGDREHAFAVRRADPWSAMHELLAMAARRGYDLSRAVHVFSEEPYR